MIPKHVSVVNAVITEIDYIFKISVQMHKEYEYDDKFIDKIDIFDVIDYKKFCDI